MSFGTKPTAPFTEDELQVLWSEAMLSAEDQDPELVQVTMSAGDVIRLTNQAHDEILLSAALKGLLEAHRAVFRQSLFAAFRAGKSTFQKSWIVAAELLKKREVAVGEAEVRKA